MRKLLKATTSRLGMRIGICTLAMAFSACGGNSGGMGDGDAGDGKGDGGVGLCIPGAIQPCYSGPDGTQDIGVCSAGVAECDDAGQWGTCVGEKGPGIETCATAEDDDCDGQINEEGEGCTCMPAETRDCYTADPLTENVGLCHGGTETCVDLGTGWGDCTGELGPVEETCETIEDDDCDGLANESGVACVCMPGSMRPCYTGAAGTENVGTCTEGLETCLAEGTGWGACLGEVLPDAEQCDKLDNDCNGIVDDPPDIDGDGWNECENDCCETTMECSEPALVNPGAFEFVGNSVDDDCDLATSDTVAATDCSSTAATDTTATQLSEAMDLCRFSTANPPAAERKWGVISAEFLQSDGSSLNASGLSQISQQQAAVMMNYGTGGIAPQLGLTMAGLSTGRMRDQSATDYSDPNPGIDFGRTSTPPPVYLAANGGVLPASSSCNGSCPAGAGANDSVNLKLTIRVPTNAQSFSYKFKFLSSEYLTYACSQFNDFYLALLTSSAAGLPADKNISFDTLNNPVSVNNGFFDECVASGCYTCPGGAASLAGTGMEIGNTGGATRWLTTTAPVVPGETITLEFTIFDVSDNILDSNVLLDGFEWSIDPSGVGTGPG